MHLKGHTNQSSMSSFYISLDDEAFRLKRASLFPAPSPTIAFSLEIPGRDWKRMVTWASKTVSKDENVGATNWSKGYKSQTIGTRNNLSLQGSHQWASTTTSSPYLLVKSLLFCDHENINKSIINFVWCRLTNLTLGILYIGLKGHRP